MFNIGTCVETENRWRYGISRVVMTMLDNYVVVTLAKVYEYIKNCWLKQANEF